MEELEPEHEPVFEELEALEPAAGIGPEVLGIVVEPPELVEQLDPRPPELADEPASPVLVMDEAKADDDDAAWASPPACLASPLAFEVAPNGGCLKVLTEELELVEQLPE